MILTEKKSVYSKATMAAYIYMCGVVASYSDLDVIKIPSKLDVEGILHRHIERQITMGIIGAGI